MELKLSSKSRMQLSIVFGWTTSNGEEGTALIEAGVTLPTDVDKIKAKVLHECLLQMSIKEPFEIIEGEALEETAVRESAYAEKRAAWREALLEAFEGIDWEALK